MDPVDLEYMEYMEDMLDQEDLVDLEDLEGMVDLLDMVADLPWLFSRPWPWWEGVWDPCPDLRATG